MSARFVREKLIYFILGLSCGVTLLLLMGTTEIGPPHYGRYQISAWGGQLGADRGGVGVFIVDTATGETKTVYSRLFTGPDKGQILKDDLRKPFYSIK